MMQITADLTWWIVSFEGISIGKTFATDAKEAILSLLGELQLTRIPEGMVVKAQQDGGMIAEVMFAMKGQIYKTDIPTFTEAVENTDEWRQLRQVKRRELDALKAEITTAMRQAGQL